MGFGGFASDSRDNEHDDFHYRNWRIWFTGGEQQRMQHRGTPFRVVYTVDGRNLRGGHPHHHGRDAGVLAQVLQRAEGRNALGRGVFVYYQERMVRERRAACGYSGYFTQGSGQHDLDVVPLLHPVDAGAK